MTDWRAILIRYMGIVGRAEGVLFLHDWEWTAEDWAAIQSIIDEVPAPGEIPDV